MITDITITEYLDAQFDGVELDATPGTNAHHREAIDYMRQYTGRLCPALCGSFPDAEVAVDWLPGMGTGSPVIQVTADTPQEEHCAANEIHLQREDCWEAIW